MKAINYLINHKVEIGFTIVGVLSIFVSLGLFTGVLNNKPTYLKFYGGLITAVVATLFYLITFVFDKAGSKKSDDILANTETTVVVTKNIDSTTTENLRLTKQVDTTVIDSKNISEQTNENVQVLREKLKEQNQQISVSQKTIDKLRNENIELHERVAHISNNIYNTMYGGDSYFSIDILHIQDGSKSFKIQGIVESSILHQPGKYPIKSAEISIFVDNKIIYSESKRDISTEIVYNLTTYTPPKDKDFFFFQYKY